MSLPLYFITGVLISLVTTGGIRAIAQKNASIAAALAFSNTFIGMFVVVSIVQQLQSVEAIVAYALGIGVGTYIAIIFSND